MNDKGAINLSFLAHDKLMMNQMTNCELIFVIKLVCLI